MLTTLWKIVSVGLYLKEIDMPNWKTRLKKFWNENPEQCIVIGICAVAATAKLIDACSAAQGRRAYAKQIDYKVRGR